MPLRVGAAEDRACVVTDDPFQTIVHPGLDGIAIVKTGDRRWNEAVLGEDGRIRYANLCHPGLVELNLKGSIVVSSIIEFLMGESVGDVGKNVTVSNEPAQDGVKLGTGERPGISGPLGRPQISASAEGLLELQSSITGVLIVDGVVRSANTHAGVRVSGVDNITVAVVSDLKLVLGTSGQA